MGEVIVSFKSRFIILCILVIVLSIIVFTYNMFTGGIEHRNVSFDISPKGDQIVYAAADGNLYFFNLKTKKVVPFLTSNI